MKVTRNIDTGDEKQTIRTISTKPKEHFEGRWKSGRLYPLYSVVVNNGTTFISQNAKMKEEPYVIYDADKKEFKAPDGWLIKEMSADSRVTALGGGGEGGVTPDEVEEMIKDKVDKVDGKGLSTNDYDNEEKNKVASAYQKPNNGIPKSDLAKAVQDVLDDADCAYMKPVTGIPFVDLADGVQDSLSNADEAKAGLAGKQNTISDLQTIRTGAAAGATAYQKPSGGVPKSDLASAVQTSLGKADTAIQPAEFNELEEEVGTIRNGAYEEAWDGSSAPVVAGIPAGVSVTYNSTSYTGTLAPSASTVDKIYLVSDGNGNYGRYVTVESGGTYSWKKVGTTAIPLSDYATNAEVSQLEAEEIDLSDYELRDYSIKADGYYGTSSTYKHKIVPVKEGETYRIFATGTSGARYAFFSSTSAPGAGVAMPLVPGTQVVSLEYGEVGTLIVMSGCVAIALYFGQSPYNYEPTFCRVYPVPEIGKRLGVVEEEVGHPVQHVEKGDSTTVVVSAFSQKIALNGLSIPSGQKFRIQITGTATRNTQRLYINSWGRNQIALPSDSGDIDYEYVATSDIEALYFGAEVTAGGTLALSISYDIDATGIYSLGEDVDAIEDNLEDIEQNISDIEDSIGTIVDETETYSNVSCATTPKYYKEILVYETKGGNSKIDIELTNIVGTYSTIRASWGNTYKNLSKISSSHYRGSINLNGYPRGTQVTLTVYVETISTTGSCDVSIHELSVAAPGTLWASVRQRVNILKTDTQIEIYNKMKSAVDVGNCDVYFENGTYNFDETLYDYMKNTLGFSVGFELPIGGGCRYYFNGATLTGQYNGSIQVVQENCNVIGCRRTNGNFELYDGTIVANDIVYCCHDDVGTDTTMSHHIHRHINMHYVYNGGTFAEGNYICKCIGGGTGLNLTVVIDKCILEKTTDNDDKNCVTYHGLASEPADYTTSKILITNTYMTGGCGAYKKNASRAKETIQLIVSNCRTPDITHNDVDYYRAWNNVSS